MTTETGERVIVNELGNTITFRITPAPGEVTVFASGPHSEVEHTWTRMEAEVLQEMLAAVLGTPAKATDTVTVTHDNSWYRVTAARLRGEFGPFRYATVISYLKATGLVTNPVTARNLLGEARDNGTVTKELG